MSTATYYSLARHAMAEALRFSSIGAGDTVALPEFICRDLISAIHHVGAQTVYYRIDESLLPIDLNKVAGARAIVAVNYFGFAQFLEPFKKFCAKNSAVLIEDNAHGFLSADEFGIPLATRADFGVTSIRKTIRIPDGASLTINADTYVQSYDRQIPSGSNSVLRSRLLRLLAAIEQVIRLPIIGLLRSLSRVFRKVATGSRLPITDYSSETEALSITAPNQLSLRIISELDTERESERRRNLYTKFTLTLENLPLRPVFNHLPSGTVPYGYPFYADPIVAKQVGRIALRFGVEVIKWPDLPQAIENFAPAHYKNLWLVNFL